MLFLKCFLFESITICSVAAEVFMFAISALSVQDFMSEKDFNLMF